MTRVDRKPSLKDVASRAGVSAMTASNVVRGASGVSTATRERVLEAVAELGYRPNASARQLRSGRSGIIALAVPRMSSPYFAELAQIVIEEADTYGWTVLIDQTKSDPERERQVAAGIHPALIDGVIFFPETLGPDDMAERDGRVPMVLLGDRGATSDRAQAMDVVTIDNVAAGGAATRHLLDAGYQRIAAIGARPTHTEWSALRLRGYRRALANAGFPPDDALVEFVGAYTRAEGRAAADRLLELPSPPDAVFCFDDLLAIGASHAVQQRGRKVPEDLAIVGFDNLEEGAYANPPLTTIGPSKERIAALAVGLLHDRLEDVASGPGRRERAGHRLVVRSSSVPK